MTDLQPGTSAVTWAREHGVRWRGRVALTNHEPHHRQYREAVVDCYAGAGHRGEPIWVIDHDGQLPPHAAFIMDDGVEVIPWYVAGWHSEHQYVILHRFPTNYDDKGNPVRRADDGRPVNFDSWQLGPRRCYHVKLTQSEA